MSGSGSKCSVGMSTCSVGMSPCSVGMRTSVYIRCHAIESKKDILSLYLTLSDCCHCSDSASRSPSAFLSTYRLLTLNLWLHWRGPDLGSYPQGTHWSYWHAHRHRLEGRRGNVVRIDMMGDCCRLGYAGIR